MSKVAQATSMFVENNKENLLKLQEFLRKTKPQLNSEEIEKISTQLLEIGSFLVHLKIRQHLNSTKPPNDKPP